MLVYYLALPFGGLLMGMCSWMELRPWRRSASAHWTERARALHPARVAASLNTYFIPAIAALAAHHLYPQASWVAVGVLCYMGGMLGHYPMETQLFPELKGGRWFHLASAVFVMRTLKWLTLIVCAAAMPPTFEAVSAVIFLAGFGVVVALQMGAGLVLLRRMAILTPASPRLQTLVGEVASRMGVTPKNIWELQSPMAGAFAVVTCRALLFTSKLLQVAPDDELRTVCAHELGHLSESRWMVLARMFNEWVFLPLLFAKPIYFQFRGGGLAALTLLMAVISIAGSKLSRAMEKRADHIAGATKEDGPVYARALERIYRTNQTPAAMGSRMLVTHPDLYDRMVAAHLTPEYPRPQPPNRYPVTSIVLQIIVMIAFIMRP